MLTLDRGVPCGRENMHVSETILLIEDDLNDQFFVKKALEQVSPEVAVRAVCSGPEAQIYLLGHGVYADRTRFPLPTVIFLDIKMPGMNGFEVLAWLKENRALRRIPVVMVSSSDTQRDIDQAYELGASSYIVKPVAIDRLQRLFKATGEFYAEFVERPSPPESAA